MFTSDGGKRVRSARELAAHILQAQKRPGPKTTVSPSNKGDPRKQEFVKKKSKKKMVKKKK